MTHELTRESTHESTPPFDTLNLDRVIDAVESLGFLSDLRAFPLNSYENRVYQVGIEDSDPIIAKFYRPGRWQDAQIQEEHDFSFELIEHEIPIIPPIKKDNVSLFEFGGFRFALAERRGGHAPELDNLETLYTLGQHIGRIHAVGKSKAFQHRPQLTLDSFGQRSRDFLLSNDKLPKNVVDAYSAISQQLLDKMRPIFEKYPYDNIRLHGDCHPGNILTRPESLFIVDLDDCRSGPAIQDLWMLISGDTHQKEKQCIELISGYEEFCDFNPTELYLIEPLRTLRLMHYAAWLARRWHDPAFPHAFPWFNTERYWSEHVQELKEQLYLLDEPVLRIRP